jgi:uncharacterized protein YodC (DUF2158 family)
MAFKAGDVVKLKSGGPKMTVDFIDLDIEKVGCTWFEGNNNKQAAFNPASLELASDDLLGVAALASRRR